MGDGRTMAQLMRPGPEGLRGTVIPRATPGGVPQGIQPHDVAGVEVNIDPHLEGQSARVRLGDVTAASIDQAERLAREVTPDPYDTATARLRASAVMQGIAAQSYHGVVGNVAPYQPPPTTPVQSPGNIPAPHQAQFATPVQPPQRRVRPLDYFGQAPQDQFMGRPLRQIDVDGPPPTRPAEYGASPPQVQVSFEIQNFGMHRVNYHDVIVENGFLVLVYNERYQGGSMYEPPVGDEVPAMAIEVLGTNEVHLVHTTGFSYSYQGMRFCILMIERSAPLDTQAGQQP